MKTRRTRLFALLACLSMLFANQMQAQDTDDLQRLIDQVASSPQHRASGTVTDIDLSAYSEPRTTTLYVRNGVNVRFVNGTLTRATSLIDAPLVQIYGGSTLHVASSATISGGNFVTSVTLVEVKDGELDIEGGKVIGNSVKASFGFSVNITDSKGVVRTEGGEIENLYQGLSSKTSTMIINGGTFFWITINGHATMKGSIKTWISFGDKDAYIELSDGILDNSSKLRLYDCEEGQVAVKNVQSKETANCFELGPSDKEKFNLSYENNALIVRSKQPSDPNLIYNEEQLRTRLKEIADNNESSANKPVKLTVVPEGFSISKSVMISGCYVEITGGRLTISENTSHSPFGIFKNAGLILNDIEIDFNRFDSYDRGFSNEGGYLTIGSGAIFLNVVSDNWYNIPFYSLYDGIITITPTSRNVSSEVFSIYFSNFSHNAQVLFTSSPGYVQIEGNWEDYNSDKPYTLVKGSGYTLKESDFKNMFFVNLPQNLDVYYDSNDKTVKLQKKKDPNYIENEDDLQKRLDEIAAENPTTPVRLTIQDKGITLSTVIIARNGCKAILTGGNISLAGIKFTSDLVFRIEDQAGLQFENIYLDFSSVEKTYFWHFYNFGSLTLGQGVSVNAKKLYINGNCVLHGSAQLPLLYLNGDSPRHTRIYLSAKMTDTWIFDSEWKFLVEDEPYTLISGYLKYEVTADDYSRMQFVNLPDDVEIVYNDELKVVQVQKKTKECDLQSLLDGLCDVDPDCDDPSCRDIPVYDDVVVGCKEDPLQCAVDKVIDGDEDNPTPALIPIPDLLPNICMCCVCPSPRPSPQVIHIYPYSSLTIRNYNIKGGKYANQYIQVYGTLIIDVNVYIYRFIRFIHIMPGGRVIWRGGHVEDVDEIVYNEGGTLEIEGDFDNGGKRFVNPEGCTLIIRDGTFTGDIENHGTLIIEGGEVKGKVENYKDFRMEGGTVDYEIWSETDIWIKGGVRVTNIHIKRGCRVHVIGRLKAVWRIHFFNIDDFDVYVPVVIGDDSYQLTAEDCEYVQIELPAGYRWEYYKGVIVIVRIPYDVATIVEYLDYFGPQGTWEKPWSFVYDKTNIDINIDWHIVRDYHLIFDGGTFTMNGGDIYIDQGASLWLKNIRFRGIDRHVYVYGTLYIDENVDFADIVRFIHVCRGGEIRFVTKPDYTVNIIVGEEDIVIDKAVIYGIIKAWLQYLNITLPDGYKWEYDDATHTIAITFSSGINDIQADRNAEEPVYDLSGKKLSKPRKGLNIVGGKKAVIK